VYFIICFDVTPDKKIGSLSRQYKYMKSAKKSCLVHGGYSITLTKQKWCCFFSMFRKVHNYFSFESSDILTLSLVG